MANFSKNRHISDVELNQGVCTCSFFHRPLFLTKRNSIFEKVDKIIFESSKLNQNHSSISSSSSSSSGTGSSLSGCSPVYIYVS